MKILLLTIFILYSLPVHAVQERYELFDGSGNVTYFEDITLTKEEEIFLWKSKMKDSDLSDDMENIIDALDVFTRGRISVETLDKYNAKKSLRALKP